MSEYLPVPRGGLFSSSLDRQTNRVLREAQARDMVGRWSDRSRVERIVATTEYGMAAAGHLSEMDRMLCDAYPEAREEIRAVHRAGVIGIASVVQRAGLGL